MPVVTAALDKATPITCFTVPTIELTTFTPSINAVPLDIIEMATIRPDTDPAICARDMNLYDNAAHAHLR
ncbi:hypothetical protein HY26_18335 [Hyphomonas sp. GM-8P]|nr:hypothetical protein HY26_18335 [Hyphomonas sp. GM-8P]